MTQSKQFFLTCDDSVINCARCGGSSPGPSAGEFIKRHESSCPGLAPGVIYPEPGETWKRKDDGGIHFKILEVDSQRGVVHHTPTRKGEGEGKWLLRNFVEQCVRVTQWEENIAPSFGIQPERREAYRGVAAPSFNQRAFDAALMDNPMMYAAYQRGAEEAHARSDAAESVLREKIKLDGEVIEQLRKDRADRDKRIAEIAKDRDDAKLAKDSAVAQLAGARRDYHRALSDIQSSRLGVKPEVTIFGPDMSGDDL